MNQIILKLGGKEYNAKLGTRFLQKATEGEGLTLEQLLNDFSSGINAIFLVPKLMYYAISFSAELKGEQSPLTMDEVFDLLDEDGGAGSDVSISFINALTNSLNVNQGKQKPQGKVAKK